MEFLEYFWNERRKMFHAIDYCLDIKTETGSVDKFC